VRDRDLAQLCAASYDDSVKWDHVWAAEDVHVAHKATDEGDVLVLRGSVDATDWMRDLDAMPVKHPLLGWCHGGFLRYMDLVMEEVMKVCSPAFITGHSLGAARASILAGLVHCHGFSVKQRVVFGEPRPGFGQLATILSTSGMSLRSYRNCDDPVTEVPVAIEPLLPYQHASALIQLNAPGEGVDPLKDHHIQLYVKGILV
jgi:hypothetical protein